MRLVSQGTTRRRHHHLYTMGAWARGRYRQMISRTVPLSWLPPPSPGQLDIQALRRDLTGRTAAIDFDRLSRTPEVQPHVVECPPLDFEVRTGEGCGAGKAPPA